MTQHWDPDSEKTPPWSIEEQNRLVREIDRDMANEAYKLYQSSKMSGSWTEYNKFVNTISKRAQGILQKRLRSDTQNRLRSDTLNKGD